MVRLTPATSYIAVVSVAYCAAALQGVSPFVVSPPKAVVAPSESAPFLIHHRTQTTTLTVPRVKNPIIPSSSLHTSLYATPPENDNIMDISKDLMKELGRVARNVAMKTGKAVSVGIQEGLQQLLKAVGAKNWMNPIANKNPIIFDTEDTDLFRKIISDKKNSSRRSGKTGTSFAAKETEDEEDLFRGISDQKDYSHSGAPFTAEEEPKIVVNAEVLEGIRVVGPRTEDDIFDAEVISKTICYR